MADQEKTFKSVEDAKNARNITPTKKPIKTVTESNLSKNEKENLKSKTPNQQNLESTNFGQLSSLIQAIKKLSIPADGGAKDLSSLMSFIKNFEFATKDFDGKNPLRNISSVVDNLKLISTKLKTINEVEGDGIPITKDGLFNTWDILRNVLLGKQGVVDSITEINKKGINKETLDVFVNGIMDFVTLGGVISKEFKELDQDGLTRFS